MPMLLLVLLPLLGSAAPSMQVTGCEQPREACALFNQFLSALNARDWEAFRATFDDEITVMFDRPGPPQRQNGRTAVEALFRRIFPAAGERPAPPPAIQPDGLVAQDLGDAVVVSFHIRGADETARRTVVLHRTARGWRVVHIHASSSAATAAPRWMCHDDARRAGGNVRATRPRHRGRPLRRLV